MKQNTSTTKNVLLLTSPRESGWIDVVSTPVGQSLVTFISDLNKESDISYYVTTLDKLDFSIKDGAVSIFDRYNNRDLSTYDIVHLRNVTLYTDHARALSLYMHAKGKKILESVDTEQAEYGKLSQMVLFALNGLPVPNTWSSWHVADTAVLYEKKSNEFPYILKANAGIKGQDNYLIQNVEQEMEILKNNSQIQFVAQNYIPNEKDFRVLWFADNPLIFSRSATAGSHLNNTSRGGVSKEIDKSEFDASALELARRAGQLTRRHFSGVDVMQSTQTGDWYVLEVNSSPALTTGDLLEKKSAMYKEMIGEML